MYFLGEVRLLVRTCPDLRVGFYKLIATIFQSHIKFEFSHRRVSFSIFNLENAGLR